MIGHKFDRLMKRYAEFCHSCKMNGGLSAGTKGKIL